MRKIPQEKQLKEGFNKIETPTLEELIDACGWRFACLGKSLGNKDDWYACAGGNYKESDNELKYDLLREGKTPSEAVANLWLAIKEAEFWS